MMDHDPNKTISNHYVFIKYFSRGDFIILSIYVDDILIVGHNNSIINNLKK